MRRPSRHHGGPTADLADERLKDAHQPLRSTAFREEVSRHGEDGDAGKHVIGGEAVMFEGDGRNGQVMCPKTGSKPPRPMR